MSTAGRLDPELVTPLEGFLMLTGGGLNLHNIPGARDTLQTMMTVMAAELPPAEGVTIEERPVPGPEGAPAVTVRIHQPTPRSATLPALLWIHGGGYVLGSAAGEDLLGNHFATTVECVVVSVDYRLAPEHPFPAPLEDCYAALKWLAAHSEELGVDRSRIAIGGASAGGGLAAALALLARDRGEVRLVFQLLIYPMIDDRNVAQASETLADTLLWTRENNLIGWRSYLGHEPGGEDVAAYAAPARATDLAGLPPAYIPVGSLDLFLAENIEYAQRLLAANVPTELHVYPGAFHGFDAIGATSAVAQRFLTERDHILKRALHG